MCAAYQNAVREQKMATEISAAKRERDFYMTQVDRAKAETAKAERRAVWSPPPPPGGTKLFHTFLRPD